MYVTPAQMIDGPDTSREVSELFDVDPALLRAVVGNGGTSGWHPDDVLSALEALSAIEARIEQAAGEIHARLAHRGYPLPMDAVQFPILTVWARAITRYHLHPQREGTSETTGRIERDYRDTIRALDQVAAGSLSLGVDDPLATDTAEGAVRVSSKPRMFDRNRLGGL